MYKADEVVYLLFDGMLLLLVTPCPVFVEFVTPLPKFEEIILLPILLLEYGLLFIDPPLLFI